MASKSNFTSTEENKSRVIGLVLEKKITNGEAAKQLGITTRQVRRLKSSMRIKGIDSVVHGLKGKTSNHKIDSSVKAKTLSIIKEKYNDFKPGFATEKLVELHQIYISSQTVRLWMTEEKLWKPRKHKEKGIYRSWRPRKEYYGEMQQFDGCYHLWLEDRYNDGFGNPIEMCLLLSVDDATGQITRGYFAGNEGIIAVFHFWKTYILLHGKPLIIYLDKFATYKINHKAAEDNKELMTQFQRVCLQLGIQLINANSPEAKGRVERTFETLQDRLVKELRLANIKTPNEANIFLENIFIPKFNEKFGVISTKSGDIHRPLTQQDKQALDHIFSIQSFRVINGDFTIQFKNKWYQLSEIQPTTVRAKEQVTVEEWLDGTTHFVLRGFDLSYLLLPERPPRVKKPPVILTTHKLNWRPPLNHPWRK
jgi:hypothetical protein